MAKIWVGHSPPGLPRESGLESLSTLRKKYWVLKGCQAMKHILKSCKMCAKVEGLPYSSVETPDLPSIRVSEDPLFSSEWKMAIHGKNFAIASL